MSAAMASMTAATMTAALTNMAQMSNMPQMAPLPTITNKPQMAPLPTITNKPPPSQVPQTTLPPLNLDHIEEVKRKVTQQANIYSIKELTEVRLTRGFTCNVCYNKDLLNAMCM